MFQHIGGAQSVLMNDSENNVLSTCDCVNVCLWACLEVCLQSADKTKVTYMSRFFCKTVTFPFFIISPFLYDSHKVVCEFFVKVKTRVIKGYPGRES